VNPTPQSPGDREFDKKRQFSGATPNWPRTGLASQPYGSSLRVLRTESPRNTLRLAVPTQRSPGLCLPGSYLSHRCDLRRNRRSWERLALWSNGLLSQAYRHGRPTDATPAVAGAPGVLRRGRRAGSLSLTSVGGPELIHLQDRPQRGQSPSRWPARWRNGARPGAFRLWAFPLRNLARKELRTENARQQEGAWGRSGILAASLTHK
jgi:hypothetical protein